MRPIISSFTHRTGKMKKGSSLILVLLVIAGIVTVTFATQRIVLVQFNQSNHEEDNIAAYYAAKAGVEDGLTRFRFERNVETTSDKVYRYNLTSGQAEANEVDANSPITEATGYHANDQYYDLGIQYKTDRINVNASSGALEFTADKKILKDDTLELTGFANSPAIYYLRAAFQFDQSCPNLSQAFVQVTQQTESGGFTQRQATPDNSGLYDSRVAGDRNLIINPGTELTNSIRLRAYYCDAQYAFATSSHNDGTGNTNDSPGQKFDSLTTNITATGYFGAAKRTLLATIDRKSGQLLGIYDFNAYAGSGNIKR